VRVLEPLLATCQYSTLLPRAAWLGWGANYLGGNQNGNSNAKLIKSLTGLGTWGRAGRIAGQTMSLNYDGFSVPLTFHYKVATCGNSSRLVWTRLIYGSHNQIESSSQTLHDVRKVAFSRPRTTSFSGTRLIMHYMCLAAKHNIHLWLCTFNSTFNASSHMIAPRRRHEKFTATPVVKK
jgi:hypothetical protein